MAEVLLPFATEEILKRVGSLAAQGISLAWGFKGKVEKLKKSLIMIQAVLQDAEKRQVKDQSVRLWLEKLQDVAYDAEDVLDEFDYEILRRKVEIQNSLKGKVRCFFSLSNPIAFHLSMALKVQKINESLDELQKDANGYGLRVLDESPRPSPRPSPNQGTDSFLDSSEVVTGRDDDVSKIIRLLISSRNQHVLPVIPIVGMGGLGKTTLAKMVHKEVKNRKLFDVTFWICVSDSFDDVKILGGMLQTLNKTTGGMDEINAIMTHLQEELKNKNFLLILDDVWNEEHGKWKSLKDRLLKIRGNDGNAVVVTTRSGGVASIMESPLGCRHEPGKLSADECWSIIRQIVSRNGTEPIPSELEAIGKEVAEKCGGVPLAAGVLGGMLHSEKEREKWVSIKNSDAFDASRHDGIIPILKLSYDHLSSPSLQRCFAYCSVFPKDFEIGKEQLIQLWMAEGLLGPSHERKEDMEEIGARYFSDLIALSFFQDVQRNEFENITGCKMHDLMHDLALSVSKSETMILEAGSSLDGKFRVRHLNLISHEGEESEFGEVGARKLHTLLSKVNVFNMPWKFKGLRTLNLHGAAIGELPDSICRLKHLRYLDVSHTDIKAFPESITKLYHLQTLRFSACRSITELPKKMRKLVSLRHIDFTDTPANVGCLIGLRTLPFFGVGPDKGHKIEELGCLKELGGELKICNLERVRGKEEAKGANLCGKAKIDTLVLEWSYRRGSSSDKTNEEDVLEGLQPHPNIRILKLENYGGDAFPPWLSTPALFPALKRLYLVDMGSLEEWKVPAAAADGVQVVFPRLEELYIDECPRLKSIPSMTHLSSKLVKLDISRCGVLSELCGEFQASTSSLKYLSIYDCDNLASVPSLQHCTALEELDIRLCGELESITLGGELQSLKRVTIGYCWRLRELCGEFQASTSSLKYLSLWNCSNLASVPSLQHCTALEVLDIHDCDELESITLGGELQSLKRVSIGSCGRITITRLLSCPSLKELIISNCGKFVFSFEDGDDDGLYRRRLHSLVLLNISSCRSLSCLPEDFFRSLTHLKQLTIGGFSEESEAFPGMNSIQHLSGSLEELTIIGWKKLKSIPHQLQHLTSLKKLEIRNFDGEEALPDWLGNLSSLQHLSIHECSKVKYLPSPTAMQGLSKLTSLEELDIGRCGELESITLGGELQSLKRVSIRYCGRLSELCGKFQASMSSLNYLSLQGCSNLASVLSLQHCTALEELNIGSCDELESITLGGELQSLKRVSIWSCRRLRELCGEFQASTSSLKYLNIQSCSNLASVPSLQHCTALEELDIYDCNGLESITLGGELQSLQRVTIGYCWRITNSLPIRRLLSCPSLEELIISNCGEFMFSFEDGDDDVSGGGELLPSSRLQSLQISGCPKLTSVPDDGLYRRRLHSLVRLGISFCWSLSYLPEDFFRSLTRLKQLTIGRFSEELEAFPGMNSIQHLSGSLEELTIYGWPKLESIPHQLQHLTSLKKLEIEGFEGEEALPDWLGNLSSLQHLSIDECSKVKYLPSSTAMQRLSKLTTLQIGYGTPLLGQNCAKDSGSEWPKISHISKIKIGWEIVQDKDEEIQELLLSSYEAETQR